ncbi:hypothetical protein ACJ41O_003893 [Fusarium nematophilum]
MDPYMPVGDAQNPMPDFGHHWAFAPLADQDFQNFLLDPANLVEDPAEDIDQEDDDMDVDEDEIAPVNNNFAPQNDIYHVNDVNMAVDDHDYLANMAAYQPMPANPLPEANAFAPPMPAFQPPMLANNGFDNPLDFVKHDFNQNMIDQDIVPKLEPQQAPIYAPANHPFNGNFGHQQNFGAPFAVQQPLNAGMPVNFPGNNAQIHPLNGFPYGNIHQVNNQQFGFRPVNGPQQHQHVMMNHPVAPANMAPEDVHGLPDVGEHNQFRIARPNNHAIARPVMNQHIQNPVNQEAIDYDHARAVALGDRVSLDAENINPVLLNGDEQAEDGDVDIAAEAASVAHLFPTIMTDKVLAQLAAFIRHIRGDPSRDSFDLPPPAHNNRKAKDQYLVIGRACGLSYKQIKAKGRLTEAESTLRGRYRTLIKPKEMRVRRPVWSHQDHVLLRDGVSFCTLKFTVGMEKISWKTVAAYMVSRGASYHYGPATCAKVWRSMWIDGKVVFPEVEDEDEDEI